MPKITDLDKWRVEIELAEKFRKDEFGEYTRNKISKAGYNIEYFEKGYSGMQYSEVEDNQYLTTLNLFHPVQKIITASLYYQNPRIISTPKKAESQDTAPIAAQTLNYFYVEIDAESVNNMVVWDANLLGYGVSKVGYITQFGKDVPADKKEKTSIVNQALMALGLKKEKPVEETLVYDDSDVTINSETPYIKYISPFSFGKDPRARTITDAQYVYEVNLQTVEYMKSVTAYKNTRNLKGFDMEDMPTGSAGKLAQTDIEDFKLVRVYELHYRQPDGIYVLIMSEGKNDWEEHYHEKNTYRIKGWQYEELNFNKHNHKLYPISDMTKMRALQDRITSTIDAILEQVDRFVPKIAYNESDVTPAGILAMRDGDIGSLVACTKDPSNVFKELNLTQFKADLKALIDNFIDMISLQTGLTRSQLTGVADTGGTATEATIAQGGQTLQIGEKAKAVSKYLKRQGTKLWDVIVDRVDLENLQLINGQSGVDPQTGLPIYNWLMIDEATGEKLRNGHYDFDIEVGSTQKPELAVLRKQFENFFNILARTEVISLMQQQGQKVDLAELLKLYLQLYPEMIKDMGKIIQTITPQTTGLVTDPALMQQGPGGTTQGSNNNALQKQMGMPTPTMPAELSV